MRARNHSLDRRPAAICVAPSRGYCSSNGGMIKSRLPSSATSFLRRILTPWISWMVWQSWWQSRWPLYSWRLPIPESLRHKGPAVSTAGVISPASLRIATYEIAKESSKPADVEKPLMSQPISSELISSEREGCFHDTGTILKFLGLERCGRDRERI